MTRLFAPVFWLTATIVLARLTAHLAPYLAGTDTLAEQVNGTLPAGMLYQVGLESLNTIFNLPVWFFFLSLFISTEQFSFSVSINESQTQWLP